MCLIRRYRCRRTPSSSAREPAPRRASRATIPREPKVTSTDQTCFSPVQRPEDNSSRDWGGKELAMSDAVKKVVLAYSGGLDTSVLLRRLQETYRCEVVTFTADLGQGEELGPARRK